MSALLVMAAGMGSRYGGLKQLDGFGPDGETLLDYAVYDSLRSGFQKVVFVIRPEMEDAFRKQITHRFENDIEVCFAFQTLDDALGSFTPPKDRIKPWGTGQAVLAARHVIHEPFAVINADDFYGRSAYQTLADCLANLEDANTFAMVAYNLRHTLSPHGHVSRGVCEIQDGCLANITERTHISRRDNDACWQDDSGQTHPLSLDTRVSMNFWGFQPSLFEHLERYFQAFLADHGHELKSEFVLPAVVDGLIKGGQARVKILPTEERWFGVTYPEDRPTVVDALQELSTQGHYSRPLWKPA